MLLPSGFQQKESQGTSPERLPGPVGAGFKPAPTLSLAVHAAAAEFIAFGENFFLSSLTLTPPGGEEKRRQELLASAITG
jgi:hypothetical protein